MPRNTPKGSTMADETGQAGPIGATTAKRPRKAQGPRKPSPLYAFVKVGEDGKVALANSFRDPRKMADYFSTATENGEQLMVIAPEA